MSPGRQRSERLSSSSPPQPTSQSTLQPQPQAVSETFHNAGSPGLSTCSSFSLKCLSALTTSLSFCRLALSFIPAPQPRKAADALGPRRHPLTASLLQPPRPRAPGWPESQLVKAHRTGDKILSQKHEPISFVPQKGSAN